MHACSPTFYKIWQEKSVQHFKPDPYLVTVLNCAMWCFYGMPFVHPDSLLVVTINGFGFFVEIAYITMFFVYSQNWSKRVCFLFYFIISIWTKLSLHIYLKLIKLISSIVSAQDLDRPPRGNCLLRCHRLHHHGLPPRHQEQVDAHRADLHRHEHRHVRLTTYHHGKLYFYLLFYFFKKKKKGSRYMYMHDFLILKRGQLQ